MADRRSSFPFRFWTSLTQRRTRRRQPEPPPPAVSTRTPSPTGETTTSVATSPISTTDSSFKSPTFEPGNQTPGSSTISIESITPPSPSIEVQTAIQSTEDTTDHVNLVDEPQTSSLSRSTSQSRGLSQQASPPPSPSPSPSRRPFQSRSPPQPSSPFRGSSKTRSPPSPSPATITQKKSLPFSPARSSFRSPKLAPSPPIKGTKLSSPSKESKRAISKSNGAPLVTDEEEPKPAASQHDPVELQQKAQIKNGNADHSNGLTTNDKSIKHNEMEVVSPKLWDVAITTTPALRLLESSPPIQNLHNPDEKGENKPISELAADPEETKEVVEQVRKTENIEETEKEVNGFLTPKFGSEVHAVTNSDAARDSEQMYTTKEEKGRGTDLKNDKTSTQPRRENVPLHLEIREELSTFVNKMTIGDSNSNGHDKPISVITLAGENRGASMYLGSDTSRTEGPIHNHRSYKVDSNDSFNTTTDVEYRLKYAAKLESPRTQDDQPAEAYVNNNAQSINNSLVFSCSISERNPGVHMVLANIPKEPIESRDRRRAVEARKAEFNRKNAQKVTFEPTIRRRCLQGLLLETSESETEDKEKPRRHGCRAARRKIRRKDDEVGVL